MPIPPLPQPEDELPHQAVGDESLPWKDTWYISLFDSVADVNVAMHMTVSANRSPNTRIAVGVRALGHEWVVTRREDGHSGSAGIGNSLAGITPIHLSWDSHHTLRWWCSTDEFSFEMVITGVHFAPFFDVMFPGVNPSGLHGHSYSHTEQVIRGQGTLTLADGTSREISGAGWRDRGWGRRKNDVTFNTGYDLVAGILPDGSAFALSAMRNVEHAPGAPLPVYGFLTDADTAVPAVSGDYFKDSLCFPSRLDLCFADGRRVVGEQAERRGSLGVSFHDAEPEMSGIAVAARDFYATLRDPDGAHFTVFSNEGHAMRANVTRGGKFFDGGVHA